MSNVRKQLAEALAEAKANLPTMQERETVYCSIRGDHLRTLVEFVSDHVIKGTDMADTTQAAALTDEKLAETMANAECLPGEEEVWRYLGESERNRWRAAARVAKTALAARAVPPRWRLVPEEPTPQMLSCLARRKWPEDMEAGKRLQARQRGENRVPFKTEYEIAAGQYERMLAASPALAEAKEEPGTWAQYVAGVIVAYLGGDVDDERIKPIAGIIERRLWALRPATPQPQAAQPVARVTGFVGAIRIEAECLPHNGGCMALGDMLYATPVAAPALTEEQVERIVQICNEARCHSRRTVGNRELAERIAAALRSTQGGE